MPQHGRDAKTNFGLAEYGEEVTELTSEL